jgi:integrase
VPEQGLSVPRAQGGPYRTVADQPPDRPLAVRPDPEQFGHVIRDEDGKPVVRAKYTGLHALRHFYASWCINRKIDGGLELPAKVVQERLGHSSITVTLDTYGHLFPRGDDADELAAAETALLG